MNQPTPPLRPPTSAPVDDDPWSDFYGTTSALFEQGLGLAKESVAAIQAGDRTLARQLVADAEAMFRLADRISIVHSLMEDEVVYISDPVVYAVRYAATNDDPKALARMIQAITRNQEEEADFGADR